MSYTINPGRNYEVLATRLTKSVAKKVASMARKAYRWEIFLKFEGRTFTVYYTSNSIRRGYRVRENLAGPEPWGRTFREIWLDTSAEVSDFLVDVS